MMKIFASYRRIFSISFCLLCYLNPIFSFPSSDEVLSLPGWSPRKLPSKQFSGFLNASDDGNMQMHYWAVLAEESPETAPVLFWFNGGPGASSLYGLLVELGPFLLSDASMSSLEYEATGVPQLLYNPFGWQKVATVVALSMPPPIGFSYCYPIGPSASGNDCGPWDDFSTANATYLAMTHFYEKFPSLRKNDLYLAGESYAGVYVPEIVKNILAGSDKLNLKGFAVGDACTPPAICGSKRSGPFFTIEFLYGKGAFSTTLYDEIHAVCTEDELRNGPLSIECSTSVNKISSEAGGYWVYAFYDDCWYENDIRRKLLLTTDQDDAYRYFGPPIHPQKQVKRSQTSEILPSQQQRVVDVPNGYYCGGPTAQLQWLALPEVKAALNIPANAEFFQSDNGVGFTYNHGETDLISWYSDIIKNQNLKVLVYNGDTDPCINSFQAEEWTRELNIPVMQAWRPWTVDSCQRMGGYVIRYNNSFDYLTIRGSGHMVPQFKPQATLEFLTRFLRGEDYKPFDSACSGPPSDATTGNDYKSNPLINDEEAIMYELKRAKETYRSTEMKLNGLLEEINKKKKTIV